jgi:hypothetical protein
MIPGVGNVLSAVGTGLSIYGAVSGAKALLGGGNSAPAFGMGIPPGAMPLQGTMSGPGTGMPYDPNMGRRSIFRNDPNVAETLKPYAIDDRFLKTYHRGPKGFVVLKDTTGTAFAIPKAIAIANKMWRASKKPPISVGDWSKLMGANRVVKKFRDMEKKAMKIANFRAPRRHGNIVIANTPGKKVLLTR